MLRRRNETPKPIRVVDLFAGPGGLSEGFSSFCVPEPGEPGFSIALSIEKEPLAQRTLELRAFFRRFPTGDAPTAYYRYLRGEIERKRLFEAFPEQAAAAREQAWLAELGSKETPHQDVDSRIRTALGGSPWWVLMGGPPCQLYSIIGRSRWRGKDLKRFESDPRHLLYKEYLRILDEHRPPVFVMENVPGLLSATHNGTKIFDQILADLKAPRQALAPGASKDALLHGEDSYRVYSLVKAEGSGPLPGALEPRDYIIKSEEYGIPQTRHRLILLGVRADLSATPQTLSQGDKVPTMWQAISDLPPLRSALSREHDSAEAWRWAIQALKWADWLGSLSIPDEVRGRITQVISEIRENLPVGGEFLPGGGRPAFNSPWYHDPKLKGYCNHAARRHMRKDLARYLFAG